MNAVCAAAGSACMPSVANYTIRKVALLFIAHLICPFLVMNINILLGILILYTDFS